MSTVAFIRRMLDAGFSHEDALCAAEAFEHYASVEVPQSHPKRRAANNERVWVYVIGVYDSHLGDLAKIGVSQHPERRMVDLVRERGRRLFLAETFGPFSRHLALDIERDALFTLREHQETGEWLNCNVDVAVETVRSLVEREAR